VVKEGWVIEKEYVQMVV